MYFYNSWQECLQEIERWRNLPRRLIGVSALTRKTGHTEITSFHFNVACALLKSIFELQIKCGDFLSDTMQSTILRSIQQLRSTESVFSNVRNRTYKTEAT